jgi:hypothetical protein
MRCECVEMRGLTGEVENYLEWLVTSLRIEVVNDDKERVTIEQEFTYERLTTASKSGIEGIEASGTGTECRTYRWSGTDTRAHPPPGWRKSGG